MHTTLSCNAAPPATRHFLQARVLRRRQHRTPRDVRGWSHSGQRGRRASSGWLARWLQRATPTSGGAVFAFLGVAGASRAGSRGLAVRPRGTSCALMSTPLRHSPQAAVAFASPGGGARVAPAVGISRADKGTACHFDELDLARGGLEAGRRPSPRGRAAATRKEEARRTSPD
jgi:hypothetical protein